MKSKIIFSGIMASILMIGAADAASQIASKSYVDDADAAKADKAVPAVAGNVATLNASGNLVDGGTLGTAAFTASTAYATAAQGALADSAVQPAAISDMETKTDASATYATKTELAGVTGDIAGLGTLASKSTVTSAEITDGTITTADLASGIVTSLGKADTALQSTDIADKADKATTLAGYGIGDAYTKTETDTALGLKADKADMGTLAGKSTVTSSDITDATITTADLAAGIVTSLGKADTALQLTDIAGKEDTISATNNLSGKMYDGTQTLSTVLGLKADTANLGDLAAKDTVATADIVDANVTKAKLASDVQTSLGLADSAVQPAAISDMETKTDASATYATKTELAGVSGDIAGLGDLAAKDTISNADVAADAAIAKSKLASDVQTSLGKADSALQSADISGLESTSNKSDSVSTDTGSKTKYTTVNAVETYAVPKPTANCLGSQAQCVLAINKTTGNIYWEDVAVSSD
jgi:hypothetical protein